MPIVRGQQETRTAIVRLALVIAVLAAVLTPGRQLNAGDASSAKFGQPAQKFPGRWLNCGYDPLGAVDELSIHRQNVLGLNKSVQNPRIGPQARSAGPLAVDTGDTAVIEDDGTIVVPPTQFSLKKSSVLFVPEGDGYSISREHIPFERDLGFRRGSFIGIDGRIGDGDNGYCDVRLLGAPFPFFGTYYDTIYLGTNGYITFTKGDSSPRISPDALARELPRIAPLWADLEVNESGDIYYNRLEGRHIVTWDGAGQPAYNGLSTFQAVLYDDGRIAFVYRKVKAQASLVGISPGLSEGESQPVDLSDPPSETISGPFFQAFGKQQRIDLPALLRAFYRTHSDRYDIVYVWTDFAYDNGTSVAHSFNVRNDIRGIGQKIFDRGAGYGSPERLSSIITMGNETDWPSDPQVRTAGLNSAIAIVCHELGHRWLAYVRFDADHDIKDDLLGRDNAHWSFLADTRTNTEGSFTSLMEGNAWRDTGGGTFTTIETAVNYFNPLDQYLMGLRSADEVGEIAYLAASAETKEVLREKSPVSGFSMSAFRKTTSVAQIVEREGPRIPDAENSRKQFRVAFVLLTQRGSTPSSRSLEKVARYRESLVKYFYLATAGRGSLDVSLKE